MQEKLQKLETTISTNQTRNDSYANRAKQNIDVGPSTKVPQKAWNAENSFVINRIKDHKLAKDSTRIKTELSSRFPRTKFLHTMKTADGRVIVETENHNIADNIVRNWPKDLFGGSECRPPAKKKSLTLLLKGVPLPDHIPDTGVQEDKIQEELSKTFPDCEVHRVKRPDNSPLRMLKLTLENEEDAQRALTDGVCIGNLWIRPEIETRTPKVIQCYRCLKFGHIAASCNYKNEVCSICSEEGHNYENCPKEEVKCKNCSGNHSAVSRYCPLKQQKLEELCIRKSIPLPNWLAKTKHNSQQ